MSNKILTIEFTYLGDNTKICAEGDPLLAYKLKGKLFRNYNKDSIILSKEESDKIYKDCISEGFKKTKRNHRTDMFYYIEESK